MKTKGLPENETVTKTSPVPSKLAEIAKKKLAIEVTEEQIEEANSQLQEILKSNTLSRVQIQKVNSWLELAIKQEGSFSRNFGT